MVAYHIVKIGGLRGNQASDNQAATCYAWSLMEGKDQMEVVAADLLTGEIKCRYSHVESERLARIFRNPKIR
ncbi:MAG: hypothetical protein ABSF15_27720 [Candidatus Sulfotelmatobacter sp.]|jgi:hypothetical protein